MCSSSLGCNWHFWKVKPSRTLNLPKGFVHMLELWPMPHTKNPIYQYCRIQILPILWLRNHPCLIFVESLHRQTLTATQSVNFTWCGMRSLIYMVIFLKCKKPTYQVVRVINLEKESTFVFKLSCLWLSIFVFRIRLCWVMCFKFSIIFFQEMKDLKP